MSLQLGAFSSFDDNLLIKREFLFIGSESGAASVGNQYYSMKFIFRSN